MGDLQALSASESCTEFAPGLVKAFLRPRPGYVPKVLSISFRSQVVVLQAFTPSPLSEGDDLCLLCPVRALKMYVALSSLWHRSLQLLVCFGAGRKGLAVSKHTKLCVASSTALFRGVPLDDICMAAGWSSPHIL